MFDRALALERLVGFPSYVVNYIFARLPEQELETVYTDPIMREPEDFVILAMMKELIGKPDFVERANRLVKEEFIKDYLSFSRHWIERARYFSGIDIHSVSGKEVSHSGLENSVGLKIRIFFSISS